MKSVSKQIHEDLIKLVGELGINTTLLICAIALKNLMGLANWNSYIVSSLNDSDFKKLIKEN